ncbi:MAG: glycosyltransferase [Candidatus Taylorbacteria bacterium]|nr:glycosyltransferase [Candidatus Taylorbacteria bacterium]
MTEHKIKCTVGILTFNSDTTIKATLESVRHFAEIVVCDGGSTDETLSLARAYGAKVIVQAPEYKGEGNKLVDFSGVRNQMLSVASHPWFFSLDSDELMTPSLEAEIETCITSRQKPTAFWVPRKYMLDDEVVLCASTYPTQQMRFFHCEAVKTFIKTIHEKIEVKPNAPVETLENFMLVPMNPDPMFHRAKWQHYIELEAKRRRRISLWEWVLVCVENAKISSLYFFRFVRNLFLCRGKRIPWKLEWERHVYHLQICKRFWRLIWRAEKT